MGMHDLGSTFLFLCLDGALCTVCLMVVVPFSNIHESGDCCRVGLLKVNSGQGVI